MANEREKTGAFAPSQADRKADGVASAKPTVITGSEDATANRTPGKKRQKDWEVGFDDEQPDRS
ncbi:hypothetical protein GB928_027335 [Shinella curvata]|uniref:Uncharacterized protein n=1 Tax=Shinella curvata TaxID=1817964 RepID=A0ABT8XMD9_9HYPH|nr:hypothetical protein [Shinella curvata]MCJ8056784.1 hypothetical protein [Shinella curvata]MDO6124901.1 hypothetical protein [Shinella curvata]